MSQMTKLEERLNQLAESSVNRDHLELHEADGRVRHFKQGFRAALSMPEVEDLIYTLSSIAVPDLNYSSLKHETVERLLECIEADTDAAREALNNWRKFIGVDNGNK